MTEIKHRIGIGGGIKDVYELISTDAGLSKWWTTDTHGAAGVGSVIAFRFGEGGPDFEIVEMIPDKLMRWRHTGETPRDWMGTEILFELSEDDKQTLLNFSHYNWRQCDEFFAHCSTKWAVFMLSLKSCIESGRGQPFPDDVPIDFDE